MRKPNHKGIINLKEQLSDVYTSLLNNTIEVKIARAIINIAQKQFDLTILQMERDAYDKEKKLTTLKKHKSHRLH